MAVSDTGCFSDVGSTGHSARRYCTMTGHYSRLSQPAAITEDSASSRVFCLNSHDGLSTSEAGFDSGAYERPYEPDLVEPNIIMWF